MCLSLTCYRNQGIECWIDGSRCPLAKAGFLRSPHTLSSVLLWPPIKPEHSELSVCVTLFPGRINSIPTAWLHMPYIGLCSCITVNGITLTSSSVRKLLYSGFILQEKMVKLHLCSISRKFFPCSMKVNLEKVPDACDILM